MAVAKGTQINVTVYEESAYGVPVTPASGVRLGVSTFEPQATQSLIQPTTITSDRQRSRPDADAIDVTGPLQYELAPGDIGILLKHSIGTVTTSGTGPYEHVFTPSDLPVGIEFELDNGPSLAGPRRYQTVVGGKIASVTYTFGSTGYATASWSIIGQQVTYAAAPADASPLVTTHRSMSMARATIEKDGVALGVASDITLTLNNNVETDIRAIQPGGLRIDAPEGFVDVNGTLTSFFTDATLLDDALSGTPADLKIILQRGTGDGTQDNEYLDLFVGKLIFEPTSSTVTGPTSRRLPLNFIGYRDGSIDSITATLRNQLAGVTKP